MLRKEGDKAYGVLNDFDLAVDADIKSASSKQRTGTKPFMAIDLLRDHPSVHMYRHDLESMFYVLVWITSRFHNGEEIADPPLQEWADQGGTALVDKKLSFMLSLPPPPTAEFDPLGRWVAFIRKMIRGGFWRGQTTTPSLIFPDDRKMHLFLISTMRHLAAASRLTSFR
jgi:hypothetical protein